MKKTLLLLLAVILGSMAKAARIDTIVVHSDKMNRDIELVIVVPTANTLADTPFLVKGKKARKAAAKSSAANAMKAYPVVYLLHGAYGDAKTWVSIKPNLPEIADEKKMIFVTPAALNSWYFDSPKLADFQYETFVSKDLVAYVDSHYPTIPRREARAISGLSMGGHGALFLAMRHKDVFGAAGSMSGGVDIRPFPLNWNISDVLGEMAANMDSWNSHTVVNQIDRIENGDIAITFDCGEDDFFLEVNKDLHKRLLGRGINHDFTTRPGGHTSEYWNNSLDYHLLFFQKYFNEKLGDIYSPTH